MREHPYAIGLMSGTSLDGLDAALIRTDGMEVSEHGPTITLPMPPELGKALRLAMHGQGDWLKAEQDFTHENAGLVKLLLKETGIKKQEIGVIGFHGQTLIHRPSEGITWQIGNGALLAEKTGIPVVCDFRRRDVAAGGEGAPLVPLYHAALARQMPMPLAVLNLGGIGNVTWIGRSEARQESITEHDIIAFDTGPGNILLNEWMREKTGDEFDRDGAMARLGNIDDRVVDAYLAHPYFSKLPPKSLDRQDFNLSGLIGLSTEDGAATLAALTAECAARAAKLFPAPAKRWLVTGGGRHHPVIMQQLAVRIDADVDPVEAVGWRGDALEAEAFAFLAVRAVKKLALSLPTITGANRAVTGGAFYAV